MIVEITGVNTRNKGAELMLVAIREHFSQYGSDVQLAVDQWFGHYQERGRYGLLQKPEVGRIGRSRLALSLMPSSFKKTLGVVTDRDIDAVLDASGFAFGDQHPPERTIRFAQQVAGWRDGGKPVVLLPQALGPFKRLPIRNAFSQVVKASNLVYARDAVSLEHVLGLNSHALNVHLAPDFTNLVAPGQDAGRPTEHAFIVPNQRMIEKADTLESAEAYLPFLAACIAAVERAGLRPVILLHGSDDADLLAQIRTRVGREIPFVREDDPVALKRRLGAGALVIGSRFHALASALSQGVPCIATSWSHKYEMLFADYDCEDMILPVTAGQQAIHACVEHATGSKRTPLVARIQGHADRLKRQVEAMWNRVDRVLGLVPA